MVFFILFILLVFAAGVGAILLLHPDSGYVLVNYGPWMVETSLAVLVIGVGLWFLLVYLLLKLLGAAVQLPGNLRVAIGRNRDRRARESFETGMLALFEGNWRSAEVELVRRAADHHAPHLNYLAAARAAQRQGATERRDHYLRLAALNRPEHEFAMLLSAADLQRKLGEFAAVKATALRLRTLNAAHGYAVELLAESHAALQEWEPLRTLLLEPAAREALKPARYDELMLRSLAALMQAAVAETRLDRLKNLWEGAGGFREDPALRLVYARGLARLNADADAIALISQVLAKEWDAGLVSLFGELHANDSIAHLAIVEQWLGRYTDRPELLALAGRACLQNRLWGKARSYLEAAVQRSATPQAYLDLGRLCQETQQPEDAARYFRQGLEWAARPSE